MCVLENKSTPNGIFPVHRDDFVTELVNMLFRANKISNAKDCEGHSVWMWKEPNGTLYVMPSKNRTVLKSRGTWLVESRRIH